MRVWVCLCAMLAATGCALPILQRPEAVAPVAPQEAGLAPLPEGGIRPKARPDRAGAPEVAAETAPGALGVTVASLGNPAEGGLWLKTPLVQTEQAGRVGYLGQMASVTLIPLDGEATAGSRMSLAAFQALGASLTDLPEITVFAP